MKDGTESGKWQEKEWKRGNYVELPKIMLGRNDIKQLFKFL